MKTNYRTTFHRDGSVSYWNVYQQTWVREQASRVSDQDLASMSSSDRERVVKMAEPACSICGTPSAPDNLKHLAIYVAGSEGIAACTTRAGFKGSKHT